MLWMALGIAVVLAVGFVALCTPVRTAFLRRRDHDIDETGLVVVRRLVAEDVEVLRDEVDGLTRQVAAHAGTAADDDLRADLDRATSSMTAAQRPLDAAEDVAEATSHLATARLALAAATSRVTGEPLPPLPTVCFFDARHGLATAQPRWTQPGHGTRVLPACATCAGRIADGARPDLRTVEVGGRPVPYWEAGEVFHAYGQGYFPAVPEDGGAALAGATAVFHDGKPRHVTDRHDVTASMARYGYLQEANGLRNVGGGFSGGGSGS